MAIPASARRIAIIGNVGGGKSALAARIARGRGLPWREVDSAPSGPSSTTVEEPPVLAQWAAEDEWVIDGLGPWDELVARFERAEVVVFVDHPVWVHNWQASWRQVGDEHGVGPCRGLPGLYLQTAHARVFETIDEFDRELRPRLLAHFESMTTPLVTIRGLESLAAACEAEAPEPREEVPTEIRAANLMDLASLARLHSAFCRDQSQYEDHVRPNPSFDPDAYFRRRISDSNRVTLVAERNAEVVGFVDGMLFSKGSPSKKKLAFLRRPVEEPLHLPIVAGYLNNIYVIEDARRTGLARGLIEALGQRMRGMGAEALYTDVMDGNGASTRMFEAAGFRRVRIGMRWELGP